ncbi:MAG: hypothetical protein IT557_06410 [Alphaproteobacteria bacterium]|nr:hypothetical protein [Alphaproteobacteria bacterium]
MRHILASLALATSLATSACTHPDGQVDWGSTALVGLGAVALGTIAVAASKDDRRHDCRYGRCGGYGYQRSPHAGYAYSRPPHGSYRRW